MNGPKHYKEAERLLDLAADLPISAVHDGLAATTIAQAQAHAALALAAATAYPAVRDYMGDEATEPGAWTRVTA